MSEPAILRFYKSRRRLRCCNHGFAFLLTACWPCLRQQLRLHLAELGQFSQTTRVEHKVRQWQVCVLSPRGPPAYDPEMNARVQTLHGPDVRRSSRLQLASVAEHQPLPRPIVVRVYHTSNHCIVKNLILSSPTSGNGRRLENSLMGICLRIVTAFMNTENSSSVRSQI